MSDREGPPARDEADPGIRLLDLAAVLLRRWRLIAGTTVAVLLLAAVYLLLQPRTYTARVALVPSNAMGSDMRLELLAAQVPGLAGRLGAASPGDGLVKAILRSRSLQDSVISQMRSEAAPEAVSREELREILEEQTTITSDPLEQSIHVDVTATDPRLATRIANQFPEVVNSITTSLAVQSAIHKRETLEHQLTDAGERLQRSEERLSDFQERVGAPEIQEQARQTIVAAAEIQRTIAQQEVRAAQLRRVSTPDNPQYRAALAELATLRDQLRQLTSGRGDDVFLSKSQLPEVRLEISRLLREFMKDEQVYLSLTAELAAAQVNAGDDIAAVSVLDRAEIPDEPSGPRVAVILLLGGLTGLMLGLFLAFAKDFLQGTRQLSPEEPFFLEWDRIRGRASGRVPVRPANGKHSGS